MAIRRPTGAEDRLLRFLSGQADDAVSAEWMDDLMVGEMTDGGMGSLRLLVRGADSHDTTFGKVISACQFDDSDGVKVVASLYANSSGVPFELDIWKVNFSRLMTIPERFDGLPE